MQNVADAVAAERDGCWKSSGALQVPELHADVMTIGIGIDGTCLLMCEDSWREAMVGTISLYDKAGERLYTTYIGATPEYGKKTFFQRMEIEIAQGKCHLPRGT